MRFSALPAAVTLAAARRALRAAADPARAVSQARFFKTGPGEYAEGDRFLGVTVPQLRAIATRVRDLPWPDTHALLRSPIHEARLLALLVLVDQHRRAGKTEALHLARRYLAARRHVDNWDLVDVSAPDLVGPHLDRLDPPLLRKLAGSRRLWDRRIAIVSTLYEIRRRRHERCLRTARRLLTDDHDLIHKAVGWMLREVGKRDVVVLERFLRVHQGSMPRTMLRYAIERFPAERRRAYLAGRG